MERQWAAIRKEKPPTMPNEICLIWQDDETWHDQWTYLCRNMGVDRVYFLQMPATARPFRTISCTAIDDLSELNDKRLILLAPENGRHIQGKRSLLKFQPSENDLYIFGHDHKFLMPSDIQGADINDSVYLPCMTDDDMFTWQCGAVVLWHRLTRLEHGKPNHRQ